MQSSGRPINPIHSNIPSMPSKPLSSVIDQIPNQITQGKISNNINNNYNTFNINNIFKNIVPKNAQKEALEVRKEPQKSNRIKSKRKKTGMGKLPSNRILSKYNSNKKYFFREKLEDKKSKMGRIKQRKQKKGTSQIESKKKSRQKRKITGIKHDGQLKKTDSLQANLKVSPEKYYEYLDLVENRSPNEELKPEHLVLNFKPKDRKKSRQKPGSNQSKVTKKLKKAKSIDKFGIKNRKKLGSENKYQSNQVLLKAHKSIPNLKHFTQRKKNKKRRKLVSCKSKKAGKPKSGKKHRQTFGVEIKKKRQDYSAKKVKRTVSKKKLIKVGNSSKTKFKSKKAYQVKELNPNQKSQKLVLFQKKPSKKSTIEAQDPKKPQNFLIKKRLVDEEEERKRQFFETVDEIGYNKESLIEKVKKLKFSELPKKSLRQKEKSRFLGKTQISKVKFALESSFPRQQPEKSRQESMNKGENRQRSRSGQRVIYTCTKKIGTKRKNNGNIKQKTKNPG